MFYRFTEQAVARSDESGPQNIHDVFMLMEKAAVLFLYKFLGSQKDLLWVGKNCMQARSVHSAKNLMSTYKDKECTETSARMRGHCVQTLTVDRRVIQFLIASGLSVVDLSLIHI